MSRGRRFPRGAESESGRRIDHRLFALVFVLAAALRVAVLLAYRPALLFFGDSYAYVAQARRLVPGPWRPLGYPLFLRPLLSTGHLVLVPAVQHVVGLAIGVVVYALCRRLGTGSVAGTLAAAPVLLDGYQLDIEQFVLAEPLFELLLVGALTLLVWNAKPSVRACALAGVLLAYAAVTRTVGLFVLLPVAAYVLVQRFDFRRVAAIGGAVVLVLGGYGIWYQAARGAFALTGRDGYFLYGRVASFAECGRLSLPPLERRLCEKRPPADRPGPNTYLWSATRSPIRRLPDSASLRNSVLRRFALRIVEHQPLTYLRVVGGDVAHYFALGRTTGPRDEPLRTWRFPLGAHFRARALHRLRLHLSGSRAAVGRSLARFLRAYQAIVFMPGPALALALALGACAGIGSLLRRSTAGAAAALFAFAALALLVGAAATSMFDYRYMLPALPLAALGGMLGWRSLAGAALYPARPRAPRASDTRSRA